MHPFQKNNKGFTLIELLVVIAIIGLLATIIMINLNNARMKASNTLIISAMVQFHKWHEAYYIENDGHYIDSTLFNCSGTCRMLCPSGILCRWPTGEPKPFPDGATIPLSSGSFVSYTKAVGWGHDEGYRISFWPKKADEGEIKRMNRSLNPIFRLSGDINDPYDANNACNLVWGGSYYYPLCVFDYHK